MLAAEVTTLVHGEAAARRAIAAAEALFGQGDLAALDAATLESAIAELPNADATPTSTGRAAAGRHRAGGEPRRGASRDRAGRRLPQQPKVESDAEIGAAFSLSRGRSLDSAPGIGRSGPFSQGRGRQSAAARRSGESCRLCRDHARSRSPVNWCAGLRFRASSCSAAPRVPDYLGSPTSPRAVPASPGRRDLIPPTAARHRRPSHRPFDLSAAHLAPPARRPRSRPVPPVRRRPPQRRFADWRLERRPRSAAGTAIAACPLATGPLRTTAIARAGATRVEPVLPIVGFPDCRSPCARRATRRPPLCRFGVCRSRGAPAAPTELGARSFRSSRREHTRRASASTLDRIALALAILLAPIGLIVGIAAVLSGSRNNGFGSASPRPRSASVRS